MFRKNYDIFQSLSFGSGDRSELHNDWQYDSCFEKLSSITMVQKSPNDFQMNGSESFGMCSGSYIRFLDSLALAGGDSTNCIAGNSLNEKFEEKKLTRKYEYKVNLVRAEININDPQSYFKLKIIKPNGSDVEPYVLEPVDRS